MGERETRGGGGGGRRGEEEEEEGHLKDEDWDIQNGRRSRKGRKTKGGGGR